MYTREQIQNKITTDPKWVERGIVAIYRYQTSAEQRDQTTEVNNKVGFNSVDAQLLSSFAKHILNGRSLTERQLPYAFRKMKKYAGQLTKIANGETK